mmetsp:Transcript_9808/g.21276  ORF Transcript_9808/g.21276 Transcript_9808/m.21276 type:complete len:258 (+) Transcript_9808:1019-1792(+)
MFVANELHGGNFLERIFGVPAAQFSHLGIVIHLDGDEFVRQFKDDIFVVIGRGAAAVKMSEDNGFVLVVVLFQAGIFVVATAFQDGANFHVAHDGLDGFLVRNGIVRHFFRAAARIRRTTTASTRRRRRFVAQQDLGQSFVTSRGGNVTYHRDASSPVNDGWVKRNGIGRWSGLDPTVPRSNVGGLRCVQQSVVVVVGRGCCCCSSGSGSGGGRATILVIVTNALHTIRQVFHHGRGGRCCHVGSGRNRHETPSVTR